LFIAEFAKKTVANNWLPLSILPKSDDGRLPFVAEFAKKQ